MSFLQEFHEYEQKPYQPLLYQSAKMPGVIMENVMVDYKGNVYFENKNTKTI